MDAEQRAREIANGAPLTEQERLYGVGVTPSTPVVPVPKLTGLRHPLSGKKL